MINSLTDVLRASGSEQTTVNVADYFSCATLDIIGRVSFGHKFMPNKYALTPSFTN